MVAGDADEGSILVEVNTAENTESCRISPGTDPQPWHRQFCCCTCAQQLPAQGWEELLGKSQGCPNPGMKRLLLNRPAVAAAAALTAGGHSGTGWKEMHQLCSEEWAERATDTPQWGSAQEWEFSWGMGRGSPCSWHSHTTPLGAPLPCRVWGKLPLPLSSPQSPCVQFRCIKALPEYHWEAQHPQLWAEQSHGRATATALSLVLEPVPGFTELPAPAFPCQQQAQGSQG